MSGRKSKIGSNPLRVRRMRQAVEELNYVSRVLNDVIGPLRDRRTKVIEQLRELMIDEGVPLDAAELKIDDEKMTIEWVEAEKPQPAPSPAPVAPPVAVAADTRKRRKA